MAATSTVPTTGADKMRWVQLGLGLLAMMAISSPQYVWTLFVKSFQTTTGAELPAIQVTFSLLIVLQTFFSPAQGWLIDRFGPRALITTGAALSASAGCCRPGSTAFGGSTRLTDCFAASARASSISASSA
jgi:MFS family permease